MSRSTGPNVSFTAECVAHARALVGGRSVIIGGGQLAAGTRRVRGLRELGARRCFIVATGVGTGPLPDPMPSGSSSTSRRPT